MKIIGRTVTFDAADIDSESGFWAAVFDGEAVGDDEYREIRVADGTTPVGVQLAPAHTPVGWPENPARTHLDLVVEDITAAHEEILALGAELIQQAPQGEPFNVYRSPAGHPFCLCWSPEGPTPS